MIVKCGPVLMKRSWPCSHSPQASRGKGRSGDGRRAHRSDGRRPGPSAPPLLPGIAIVPRHENRHLRRPWRPQFLRSCRQQGQGADQKLRQTEGQELKLVYPQSLTPPEKFTDLHFDHFFLQPMDGPTLESNLAVTMQYCLEHPQWRLSLQTHKYVGLK